MLTQVPQRWLDRHPKSEPCPSPKDDGEVRCFWSLVIAPALYPALLQVYPSLQIRLYHRLFTSRAFGSANVNRCRALVDGLSFRHRLVVTPSLA